MDEVEVVVAHTERATLRVGETFLKVDGDPAHAEVEIRAMGMVPELDRECAWLLEHAVLPAEVIHRNREIAEAALRPWSPSFIHGDLQLTHVFVDGDEVTGIIDWSEAAPGDAMYDLAILTLGHEERLDDLLAGYGPGADRDVIRAWWSLRSLVVARWLSQRGFDPDAPGCEFDVLRARMQDG
ncbi:phosphotransferase [Brachybacterium sp. AOP3-A1-3]|uniref:phosphotransferase n=1 Tax=Brachybacterium sp. AOP3-A1-3 TaxID=3457699 RepID=UPI0040336A79